MDSFTRMLLIVAAACLFVALLWHFGLLQKLHNIFPLGRLPGDLTIEIGSGTVFLPITTCMLISLLLSALMWLFRND